MRKQVHFPLLNSIISIIEQIKMIWQHWPNLAEQPPRLGSETYNLQGEDVSDPSQGG